MRKKAKGSLGNVSLSQKDTFQKTKGLHWRIFESFLSPLGILAIWAVIFSFTLDLDIFSHLAQQAKSEQIAEQQSSSKDIVVIEFDALSMAQLGDNADEAAGIFQLVDTLLAHAKPKQIVLDYALMDKQSTPIAFKPDYAQRLTWGVVPFWRGSERIVQGYHPSVFQLSKRDEYRLSRLQQPWGHLHLGLTPGTQNAVSRIELIQNEGGMLTPSLALAAYWRGEFNQPLSDAMINFKHGDTPNCELALFDKMPPCDLLVQPNVFYAPPLPSYFPQFSAFDFMADDFSSWSSMLDDKYVFISSTWSPESDHYHNGLSSVSDVIGSMLSMIGFMDVTEKAGAVPGVYFHAAILESLLNDSVGFPVAAGASHTLIHSVSPVLMLFLLCLLIKKLVAQVGLTLNEDHHFWSLLLVVCVIGFPLFEAQAVYALCQLNTLVYLMLPYMISCVIGTFIILGARYDD